MQKIIVDIDNTLWDFAEVFHDRIKGVAPFISPVNEWNWDFYKDHISVEDLYNICNDIHREQDVFEPFPFAKWFLESLHNEGYEIIIASHRDENSRKATEKFLRKHDLPYSELHLSQDKTVLFDTCTAIVDDAPHILDEARKRGLVCTGLRYAWNKNTSHTLFDSLDEILEFLLRELNGQRLI